MTEYCTHNDKEIESDSPVCEDAYCNCFEHDKLKMCYECDACKPERGWSATNEAIVRLQMDALWFIELKGMGFRGTWWNLEQIVDYEEEEK
jgi:hypothetical protein